MTRRNGLVAGVVLVVVVLVVVVVALLSSSSGRSGTTGTAGTAAAPAVPASASSAEPAGSQVVVAMGRLDDPSNTFYEMFGRNSGSTSWVLATPPGVATNGGLVVGASENGTLTAGFLPSADLTFSVLAQRMPGDPAWTPGDVPGALAPQADAVATGVDRQVAAVLRRPAPAVVDAEPGLTGWHGLTTAAGLAGVSPRCPVDGITSVALPPSGAAVVGTGCARSSVAGLFTVGPSGRWTLLGPLVVPGTPTVTRVLRLQAGSAGLAALVEGTGSASSTLVAAWGGNGSGLSGSVPLTVPAGWSVLGTAVGGGGGRGVTVLLGSDTGTRRRVEVVDGPPASTAPADWTALAPPPSGTSAVATVGTETDAFVPAGSRLTVWSTSPGSSSWTRVSSQSVPIQYGSSA